MSLINVILSGAIINNIALHRFFGAEPLLGYGRGRSRASAMGMAVTAVMTVSGVISWPLGRYLEKAGVGYLSLMLYAVIICLVCLALWAALKPVFKKTGVWLPIVALNSGVLGAASQAAQRESFLEGAVMSVSAGLGFWLAVTLLAGLQSRIKEQYIPRPFRGLPVQLLTAAILSMAFLAFK